MSKILEKLRKLLTLSIVSNQYVMALFRRVVEIQLMNLVRVWFEGDRLPEGLLRGGIYIMYTKYGVYVKMYVLMKLTSAAISIIALKSAETENYQEKI